MTCRRPPAVSSDLCGCGYAIMPPEMTKCHQHPTECPRDSPRVPLLTTVLHPHHGHTCAGRLGSWTLTERISMAPIVQGTTTLHTPLERYLNAVRVRQRQS